MSDVEHFLSELARGWRGPERPTLRILGSTALFLRTNYLRGTKDSDVLETAEPSAIRGAPNPGKPPTQGAPVH